MIIDEEIISFRIIKINHYIDFYDKSHLDIIPAKNNEKVYSNDLYLLIAFSGTKVMGKWFFNVLAKDVDLSCNVYNYIKTAIKKDLKNNIYTETDKQLLKIYLLRNAILLNEDRKEIEELFKSNEEIVQTDIIKPVNHINAGLINCNNYESIDSGQIKKYKDIINKTYSSMIPNGTLGERTSLRNLTTQKKYIFPIETAGDFLVTDFNDICEYRVEHENNDYLVFILYDIIPPRNQWAYIRYLAPIKIEQGSELTVNEAVENYYRTVYASLSNETKRRFEAYLRDYCNNNTSHFQKQKRMI